MALMKTIRFLVKTVLLFIDQILKIVTAESIFSDGKVCTKTGSNITRVCSFTFSFRCCSFVPVKYNYSLQNSKILTLSIIFPVLEDSLPEDSLPNFIVGLFNSKVRFN